MSGNVDSSFANFIKRANGYPLLTPERELEIATAWHDEGNRDALDELVRSHIRLVVKIARRFAGSGISPSDLIAEGNIGLMRAAEKFDPRRGCRFSTYAMWWIRSEIQDFVMRSWSVVRIGTTCHQKKLFFKLRWIKARMGELGNGDLAARTVAAIAEELDVPEAEVIEMNRRLSHADSSLNAAFGETGEGEWIESLCDEQPTQDTVVAEREEFRHRHQLLDAALKTLTPRERDVVMQRRLKETPTKLEDLSQQYAVSRERIRQIEVSAVEKLRKILRAKYSAVRSVGPIASKRESLTAGLSLN